VFDQIINLSDDIFYHLLVLYLFCMARVVLFKYKDKNFIETADRVI